MWTTLKRTRDRMSYSRPLPVINSRNQDWQAHEMGDERMAASARALGVNVAGYFESEKGVGEAARASVRALKAVPIPHVLNNVTDSGSRNREWSSSSYSEANPHPVNLFTEC